MDQLINTITKKTLLGLQTIILIVFFIILYSIFGNKCKSAFASKPDVEFNKTFFEESKNNTDILITNEEDKKKEEILNKIIDKISQDYQIAIENEIQKNPEKFYLDPQAENYNEKKQEKVQSYVKNFRTYSYNYLKWYVINKIDDSLLENFYEELNEFLEKSKENNIDYLYNNDNIIYNIKDSKVFKVFWDQYEKEESRYKSEKNPKDDDVWIFAIKIIVLLYSIAMFLFISLIYILSRIEMHLEKTANKV
ncbi:MAG: hypothetical protein KatS3mg129_0998 [Leptospiraceae bacterium]|nr:MAG: hypothetical protein KatS3mg129_0998 [Leptospiraceae bacterium]